ncbi:MAG: lysyl oxidase family protein, partial [Dehalococcoidia bacterium]
HMVAALGGAPRPPRAPDAYVRVMFDDFAEDFDRQLLEDLDYRVPPLLCALYRETAPAGEGPLDIAGSYDADAGITTATQRIHHEDGDVVEEIAGRFVFHPGHEHWHFKDFTMLELWTYGCDGELDEMKATTGKGTFCAVDEVLADETLPHVPEGPSFLECGQGVQGLSVGWSDTYTADLIGQELDIDGVPDGRYAVRTLADPAGRLREKDDDNNDLVVYVEITGAEIELLDGP